MSGSRPSQFWQKEPPATDRKWRAEDEGILEREKHEFTTTDADDAPMIPPQKRKPQNRSRPKSKATAKKKKSASKRGKSGR